MNKINHLGCRLCKIPFFKNFLNLKLDYKNKNKLFVRIKSINNIHKNKKSLRCKRCNATVGKDISNEHFFHFNRNQLVEITKTDNKTTINESFHIYGYESDCYSSDYSTLDYSASDYSTDSE